jgi:hypothetical protein
MVRFPHATLVASILVVCACASQRPAFTAEDEAAER